MRLAFVVNSAGIQERRAHELARRFPPTVETAIAVAPAARRLPAILRRSDCVYVIDAGRRGFQAALAARLEGKSVVVEVGDPGGALYQAQGRGALAVGAGAAIDRVVARHANGVVVRGRRLAGLLDVRVPWIEVPDGVDCEVFRPRPARDVRRELGLPENVLVAGLAGSLKTGRIAGSGYGHDLVEALALVPDAAVWGLIVGDGPGLAELRKRAAELGVARRLVTPGRVPPSSVHRFICAIDVCLSTQSNDSIGRARTTAKLPEYLACDRHVLATAVGGALDVLPPEMLLPYSGSWDPLYPARLAAELVALVPRLAELRAGAGTRAIALANYDYDVLAKRLVGFLEEVSR